MILELTLVQDGSPISINARHVVAIYTSLKGETCCVYEVTGETWTVKESYACVLGMMKGAK